MQTEKKLIALVDDSSINLRIGKDILRGKYTVAAAPSAKQLFSLLDNNTPALILLDIDMPYMDGFETITILKPLNLLFSGFFRQLCWRGSNHQPHKGWHFPPNSSLQSPHVKRMNMRIGIFGGVSCRFGSYLSSQFTLPARQ